MTDRYYPLDELKALPDAELQALWDAVPTDRQRAYRQAYEREVAGAGATHSDEAELTVLLKLVERYQGDGLIPLGMRWARTPSHIRQSVEAGTPVDSPTATPPPARLSPRFILAGLLAMVLLLGLFLSRVNAPSDDAVSVADAATATPDVTLTPSPTATPPLLDAPDAVVEGGDAQRSAVYPIKLNVALPDGTQRVWVVQRRGIRAAEWHYEPDPDVASFLNGMGVKPVIGLPWSESTLSLFERITPGTQFTLTLNTGATQRFTFAGKRIIQRTDTAALRQVQPGLALLLLGDADGLSHERHLIEADYLPDQEVQRGGQLDADWLPATTTGELNALDVQLIRVSTLPAQLIVRLRVMNTAAHAQTISPDTLRLAAGYTPEPDGPWQTAKALQPFALLPSQAVDLTLIWRRGSEPYALLDAAGYRIAIDLRDALSLRTPRPDDSSDVASFYPSISHWRNLS